MCSGGDRPRPDGALRAASATSCETPVPNNHLITESGAGLIAPFGDDAVMAEMIEAVARRPRDPRAAQDYVVAHHTWDRRIDVYERWLAAEFGV